MGEPECKGIGGLGRARVVGQQRIRAIRNMGATVDKGEVKSLGAGMLRLEQAEEGGRRCVTLTDNTEPRAYTRQTRKTRFSKTAQAEAVRRYNAWVEGLAAVIPLVMRQNGIRPFSGVVGTDLVIFLEEARIRGRRPDLDNFVKSVHDVLTSGGLFRNDKQVVRLAAGFEPRGGRPGFQVTIYDANSAPPGGARKEKSPPVATQSDGQPKVLQA